jgi:cytochrome c oxidase cbb3-type subunit I/II
LDDDLDISSLEAKIKAMQTLGVPYPAGFAEVAKGSLEKQSIEIQANLKKDGIETSSKKEVIALIAYLQRMGRDIKTVSVNTTK